jgi:hypothetical protein
MLDDVTTIDLADDTFVVAEPAVVAGWVAGASTAKDWFADLRLVTTRDRGLKGRQWRVDGALVGTAEVWLEPWGDGVVVHWFLRTDPAPGVRSRLGPDGGPALRRWADHERRLRVVRWKQVVHRLKDELERGRRAGEPAEAQEGAGNAR